MVQDAGSIERSSHELLGGLLVQQHGRGVRGSIATRARGCEVVGGARVLTIERRAGRGVVGGAGRGPLARARVEEVVGSGMGRGGGPSQAA